MDEGCTDAGASRRGDLAGQAAPSTLQLLIAPCAVAVAMVDRRLVQDIGHAGESRAGSVLCWAGCSGPTVPAWTLKQTVVAGHHRQRGHRKAHLGPRREERCEAGLEVQQGQGSHSIAGRCVGPGLRTGMGAGLKWVLHLGPGIVGLEDVGWKLGVYGQQ